MLKVIAWNIASSSEAWRLLVESDADIGLLQEAKGPPAALVPRLALDPAPWSTGPTRKWRTAVVGLSDRAKLQWLAAKPLGEACEGEFGVSRLGSLAAAIVTPSSGQPFIAFSAYAAWEEPHKKTGKFIYADASAHRLISDLSAFAAKSPKQDILIAGDLNILYGYGEDGDEYWAARYETVFRRMEALGLKFVGPQTPGGRRAEPWPSELPHSSNNVPTYWRRRQRPETCTRQLDFVFASKRLADRVGVRALNDPEEWGPSDHCRVEIRVE